MKRHFFYMPVITGSIFVDDNTQSVIIDNIDPNYMELTGTTLATSPGTYKIKISLRYPEICEWDNGSTDPIILDWVVKETLGTKDKGVRVFPVPTVKGTLVVNATEQHVIIDNLDNNYMELSGITTAKNAGTYNVIVSLKYPESTKWSDNSTEPISLEWKINKLKVSIPKQCGSLYYNEKEQKPDFIDYDSRFVLFDTKKGSYFGTDAGIYTIIASLNSSQFIWEDGTSENKIITWEIKRKALNIKPLFAGNKFYFSGTTQGPKITNFNKSTMKISGTYKAINVGKYHISVNPDKNYCWNYIGDTANIEPINFDWEIIPVKIQKPILSGSELIYNGREQSPTDIVNILSGYMQWSGTVSAIDVGTYEATVRLLDNYVWEDDNSRDPYTFFWSISPVKISELPFAQKLIYTGKEQQPIWQNYKEEIYDTYGDFSATEPGTYSMGFRPTKNYTWIDGSRTNKKISWKIIGYTENITYDVSNFVPTLGGAVNYASTAV